MATWDGSLPPEPQEDQNYYMYDENNGQANWNSYYPGNYQGSYPGEHQSMNRYSQQSQNYNPTNSNVNPNPNLPYNGAHQDFTSPGGSKDPRNVDSRNFYQDYQAPLPYNHHPSLSNDKDPRAASNSNNVEQSTLQATATEFFPNNRKLQKPRDDLNDSQIFFADNRRRQDNRFQGYKGNNYKEQGHKSNNYKGQGYKNQERFANERHYNKQPNDKFYGNNRERKSDYVPPNQSAKSGGASHQRVATEEPKANGNEESNNEDKGAQRNAKYGYKGNKDRKKNYQEYNGYKGKERAREPTEKDPNNWRQRGDRFNAKRGNTKACEDDDASQRERLTEQLNRGQLECLVCCEYIRQFDSVWSCINCYHVLHLKCTQKWAKSSKDDNGWRCPACQHVTRGVPEEYLCFCGKVRSPEWNRQETAHSCGEICGRTQAKNDCTHKCVLLCHPGCCPDCLAMVQRKCGCGKTSQTLKCCSTTLLMCDSLCDKPLNCGQHDCEKKCHHGDCDTCDKVVKQECFCGKNSRDVPCEQDIAPDYCCAEICEKFLDCKNHKCQEICHEGPCAPCTLKPELVTHCCCGKTPLAVKRESCLSPIPTCDQVCSKKLKCGQPSSPHTCKGACHEGECTPCDLFTKVRCRCGNMDREIACVELVSKADDARCEKKCTKKRSCGKHKCGILCCIDIEHICPLPCNKTLSCGQHKCELTCHKGRCQTCWRSSFEELYCECGTAVTYPPVPCGARRPACDRPCSREHPCSHEVLHNCHSETNCPPCTVLTQKECHGKHGIRKNIPCYVNEISCGLPCGKPLPCGRHKCITLCHPGPCQKPGQNCTQPCTASRELCGHMCNAPCHDGKCPDIPCKEMVKVICQCNHRSATRACAENSREYQRIATGILASKMADMQLGHSVDLDMFSQNAKKQNQLKTLECNEECRMIERNRRLALGLQIVNPDLSGKLVPRYSDSMKQWAKKDTSFCQMVHDKLTELVQLAKTSKQKSRSYSFQCMNREKRAFIHESCEHFGCESQAYDQEPKRNVVATAFKDKCWLPSYSLLEVFQRENGQRRVPGPMLNTSKATATSSSRNVDILPLPTKKSREPQPTPTVSKTPEPEIDYFNFQG